MLVATLVMLLPVRVHALDPLKSVWQFNVRSWTRQTGLPADAVAGITQSADGFICVATTNGLFRYDGLEFAPLRVPPLRPEQTIRGVARGGNGLWAAIAQLGIVRFAETQSPGHVVPTVGAPNPFTVLETPSGELWIGSERGLTVYRGGQASEVVDESVGPVLSLCAGPGGAIAIGTDRRGLFFRAKGRTTASADSSLAERRITALACDPAGTVWVGTDKGLRRYDRDGQRMKIAALDSPVQALLLAQNGDLWVGTSGLGLARYQNGALTTLGKADGLIGDAVTALFEDREGSLWVGTRDGLSEITDVKFPIFGSHEGSLGSVHCVAPSREGGVWESSSGGFAHLDGTRVQTYGEEFLHSNIYIKLVHEARNGDVYLVDGDKVITLLSHDRIVKRIPARDWPEALAEDAESVLVNTGSELCRIENGELHPYRYAAGPKPRYDWITNLAVDHEGAILVSSANGFFRVKDGRFTRWSTANGMASDRASFAVEDVDGTVWVGLPSGLARIRNGEVKNITEDTGLPDSRIFGLVPDDLGSLWILCSRGVVRVKRADLNATLDRHVPLAYELFDGTDSLKTTERSDQGYFGCRSNDGRIWFPSPAGVLMIDPAHFVTNAVAPQIWIDRIQAQGPTGSPTAGRSRSVEFAFAALSYVAHRRVQTQYRLAELDSSWVDAGTRRTVTFTSLPAGRYHFEVKASNGDGGWASKTVAFEILPPFYRTGWFYAGIALLSLAGLFGAYRWKVRRLAVQQRELARQNEILEQRVAERTRELAREQAQLEQAHKQLVETSRQAGMAEVATNVLHNVGNVLNSANVSATLMRADLERSRIPAVLKVGEMLEAHGANLAAFLTEDPKGRKVGSFLALLGSDLMTSRDRLSEELTNLQKNIDHIKEIVAVQQNLAKRCAVREQIAVSALIKDALRLHASEFERHRIAVDCEFLAEPVLNTERHKILQIVVNLLQNAMEACRDSGRDDRRVHIRLEQGEAVRVAVTDNGTGIAPENLTRIFSHGFTTKKDGHGFGLHASALAARELGGVLRVHSDGPNRGATFTLQLPLDNSA